MKQPLPVTPLFVRYGRDFQQRTFISPSTQHQLIHEGILPPPVKLSPKVVGWDVRVIQDFLEGKHKDLAAASDEAAA